MESDGCVLNASPHVQACGVRTYAWQIDQGGERITHLSRAPAGYGVVQHDAWALPGRNVLESKQQRHLRSANQSEMQTKSIGKEGFRA